MPFAAHQPLSRPERTTAVRSKVFSAQEIYAAVPSIRENSEPPSCPYPSLCTVVGTEREVPQTLNQIVGRCQVVG